MLTSDALMLNAWNHGTVIPAINVAYIPMMEPIAKALEDTRCFGMISVARLEWIRFGAKGVREIYQEYQRVADRRFTRLHLDHVPVIDEDGQRIDYLPVIEEAIRLGYDSVMVDGSREDLEQNIEATRRVVEAAHKAGIPVEGELGAVFGHEKGPPPPYEELFNSGRGFTDPDEAAAFVGETGIDWLSVAIGNIHGSINHSGSDLRKVQARLSIERLQAINHKARVPLVLHGGTGIRKEYLLESFKHGVAKLNIGTTVRKAWETNATTSPAKAADAVYDAVTSLIRDQLETEGSVDIIDPTGKT